MAVFVKFAGLYKFPLSSKNSFFPFSFWLVVATWQCVPLDKPSHRFNQSVVFPVGQIQILRQLTAQKTFWWPDCKSKLYFLPYMQFLLQRWTEDLHWAWKLRDEKRKQEEDKICNSRSTQDTKELQELYAEDLEQDNDFEASILKCNVNKEPWKM